MARKPFSYQHRRPGQKV